RRGRDRFGSLIEFYCGRYDAGAKRLCEQEDVSGAGSRVFGDSVRVDQSGDRVAEHNLLVIDAVTSNQNDSVLSQHFEAAAHDVAEYLKVHALLRKAGDRHRGDRRPTHSPDVVY